MHYRQTLRDAFCLGFVLLLALAFQPAAGKEVKPSKELAKALEAFNGQYKTLLAESGIIGSSFMLIHDNELVDKAFYGLANKEKNQAVDEHTIYHWASITKTFTGIAVMQLRDRGLLKLDDPIVKYLPELRGCYNPFGDMGEITIRHLMSHSAGFRGATWPWKDKPWHPHEPTTWEQLVAMIPYTEVLFKPGSQWSYSNPGIIFLGRTIELLTGDDWEVYIDKNIFKPLEMYESYFDATPYHLLKNRAQSYFIEEGVVTPAPFDVNTGITVSNGGLNAPLTDFIKYLNFLMGDPKKQAVYDGVLKRSSLEEMFQPVISIGGEEAKPPADEPDRKDYMGLTYFVEDNSGMRFVCHSGGQNAFVSHFFYQPECRTAYCVAYNTVVTSKDFKDPKNTRNVDQEIKKILFKTILPLYKPKA